METNPLILEMLMAIRHDLVKLTEEVQATVAEAKLANEMLASHSNRHSRYL